MTVVGTQLQTGPCAVLRRVLTANRFAKCGSAVEVGAFDKKSPLFVPKKCFSLGKNMEKRRFVYLDIPRYTYIWKDYIVLYLHLENQWAIAGMSNLSKSNDGPISR